mgnify:CR=1 FL=1
MYFEILLPLKLGWTPTYSSGENLTRGQRVRVSFAHREYIGVVLSEKDKVPLDPSRIQPVLGTVEGLPAIGEKELELWEFISEYYLCSLGEVYRAAYPQTKTKSELVLSRKGTASAENGKAYTCKGCVNVAPPKPEVVIGYTRVDRYVKEAAGVLDKGYDVLILVPETALGDTLEKTLKKEFKERLSLYNSRRTAARRREVADKVRSDEPVVVLGTRSSLFLPFRKLGLVIVDEEQDPSFKQTEPNPRYNGRDTAVMLARLHNSGIILGTSSPSFETLLNIQTGKYRTFGDNLPAGYNCTVIDLQAEKRKNGVRGDFSFILAEMIRECEGTVCIVRGWEKEEDILEQAGTMFPGKDTVIATQSSVLNGNATYDLIAILQADAMFDRTDFRSDEKAAHFLTRIAGKAGRIVIQTAKADHPVFGLVSGKTGSGPLMEERKDFRLPPYFRLVDVIIDDANPKRLKMFSGILSERLPGAIRLDRDNMVIFRITLNNGSKAAYEKAAVRETVSGIEEGYRYYGHIHIDVDPV